jgi:4'-phosphopantetheinyl transferase
LNSSETELTWSPAPAKPALGPVDVHVWAIPLDVPPAAIPVFAQSLSLSEKERSARFHFDIHRNRYIVGRSAMRRILSTYLDLSPGALEFVQSELGKPDLAPSIGGGLHFNLTHSDRLALCAVTRAGLVGVDLERHREVDDMDHLVARFFSPNEHTQFSALPREAKAGAFFNLWTRKESMLKATGAGITGGLNRVEVSFREGELPRVHSVPKGWPPAESWCLHTFSPAPGFTGAVAVLAKRVRLACWRLE